MKPIFSILLLVGPMHFAFAQQAFISVHNEYTVAGHQYGASVGYESKNQWGVSAFFQQEILAKDEPFEKDSFYGLHLQAPLAKTPKVSFFAALRPGVVNDKFVVVVPGLETRIALSKRICVAAGMAIRMSYPCMSSRLLFKIF
jgi:hypothetical protein